MARSPFGRPALVDPFSDEARFPTLVKPQPVGLSPATPPVFGSVEARNDPARYGSVQSRNDPNRYGSVESRNDPANFGPVHPGVRGNTVIPGRQPLQAPVNVETNGQLQALFGSPAMRRMLGIRGLNPQFGMLDEFGENDNGL